MKYKHIWVLSVALFLVSCGQPPDTTRTTRILEHGMAGDEARMKGDYAEAEKQYKNAIALAEEYGPDHPLVRTNLYPLGWLYVIQKRDAEAEAVFQRRVKIAEKSSSHDPEVLGDAYDDLAMFYVVRRRFSDAEPVFKRALDLYQKAYGADSPKMAEHLEFYARILRDLNRNDEAAEFAARAKAITSNQKQ